MNIKFDSEKLHSRLLDFYKVTGIPITIITKDKDEVTGFAGRCQNFCKLIQNTNVELCHNSDKNLLNKCISTKKPALHVCHAKLMDAALPIMLNNEIIAYVILGQVRCSDNYDTVAKHVPKHLKEKLKEYFYELPLYTHDQMESALRIANAIITKLINEEMIVVKSEELLQLATEFIEKNLNTNLSLDNLCIKLGVSKNRLYKCFRDYYNLTVNEYITKKRIEKAIILLKKNKFSIDTIANDVGFSDTSYFYKVFKKETGKTPKTYIYES